MQIFLVRHPAPIGVDGICYGRLEVPVDDAAIQAAAESILPQLPRMSGAPLSIYSSPASRCMRLARHLATPQEPSSTDDLREMDFGDWQGLRWDCIAREKIDAWAEDTWGYRPGGGESAWMVAARWERWLQQLRRLQCDAVAAVTHAGVIRVALARASLSREASALALQIPFASVHRLELS